MEVAMKKVMFILILSLCAAFLSYSLVEKNPKELIIGKWENADNEIIEFTIDDEVIFNDGKVAKFEVKFQEDKALEKDRYWVIIVKYPPKEHKGPIRFKLKVEGKDKIILSRIKHDGSLGNDVVYTRVL
jgi:hypothetical protein